METTNLPVKWDEELAKYAQESAQVETVPLGKISLKSGILSYMGQPVPENRLKCIVLATSFERRYDSKPFDEANVSPPDCFALSVTGQDMVPHDGVADPESAECANCPRNKWMPNPRKPGKNHKECKERRRLLLIPETAIAKGVAQAELAMLTVPVTSVAKWGQYVNLLAATEKRPPWAVVTEVFLRPDAKNQIAVEFKLIASIPDEHLGALHARLAKANEDVLRPWDVVSMESKPSAPVVESSKY